MKKSTGILLLAVFLACFLIFLGIAVSILVYIMQGEPPSFFGSNRVALVRVEGLIYDVEDWVDQIESYAEDPAIGAIVIRVDSAGGAVGPSQELHRAVLDAKREHGKTIVASFGSVAASGGYYIACGADAIVTTPGCMTGSIGVYAKFLRTTELFDKIGIDYETVKAGEYKDFGSMERGLNEKERDMMQHVIDDTYMQFVEAVADGRRDALAALLRERDPAEPGEYPFTAEVLGFIADYQLKLHQLENADSERAAENSGGAAEAAGDVADGTPSAEEPAAAEETPDSATGEANEVAGPPPTGGAAGYKPSRETLLAFVKLLADGKIYTGRQAIECALADRGGSLDEAIDLAAELAGIPGEVTVVERRERELSIFDLLSQKLSSLVPGGETHSPIEYRFPH